MATKCISLYKKFEESQIIISNYESAFKKFENNIISGKVQLEDTAKNLEKRISKFQITMCCKITVSRIVLVLCIGAR
jgi:hypothetical protein